MHMIAGVLQYVASPPSRRRGLKTEAFNSFVELVGRLLRGGVD